MAIDSADQNRAWDARRWTWDRRTPRAGVGTGLLLGLALLGGGAGCSKGGAPDLNGCLKLADLVPADTSAPPAGVNYAMLRSAASGALIPVTLNGGGAGAYTFTQCDLPDTYTVDKAVLVGKQGELVATAVNMGSSYQVTYASGQKTTVSGANFVNLSATYADKSMSAVAVQALSASTMMANQGDAVTVNANVLGNPCAIRDSHWWLTPISLNMPPVTAVQNIPGGAGAVTLRIPPTLAADRYYLEGTVTLTSGRVLQVKRVQATDANYTLVDSKGVTYPIMPSVPVVSIAVAAKADVDKTAPSALGISVSPVSAVRCGTVNLNLHIKDDQPLPAGQQVKVWLGQAAQPKLVSVMVVGSEYLSGSVQLPIDAPAGVWYAWPEVIRDAVGNEATATFLPDGTFSLSGQDAMAKPVPAGSFTIAGGYELPDAATASFDLAAPVDLGGVPDMAAPLPAVLTSVSVTSDPAMMGSMPVNVYVIWTPVASPLR